MVLDTETTGTVPGWNLIVQIGHCLVDGCNSVDQASFFLDWTRCKEIDQDWLKRRLEIVKLQVEFKNSQDTGRTYAPTYDLLKHKGVDPHQALTSYLKLIDSCNTRSVPIVGHNAWSFDVPFLESHFSVHLKRQFKFDYRAVLDTGTIEKAAQLNMLPWPGETMAGFANRVRSASGRGIKWSLDTHCVQTYELPVDKTQCHDAGYDAYVDHLLLEMYRQLSA